MNSHSSKIGDDVKSLILQLMESGGELKYERSQENRNLILKAIFDFNNCMAMVNPSNLISQADVTNVIISKPQAQSEESENDEG